MTPRDPDVRANLQFIRAPRPGADGFARLVAAMAGDIDGERMGDASLRSSSGFGSALLVLIQFRPQWKQSVRALLWCGGVAILVCGGCTYAAWSSESTKTAIVIATDAVIHNGPLDEAPHGSDGA